MSELQTVTPENSLPAAMATSATSAASLALALPLVLIADADAASRLDRSRHFEGRGYRVAVARTPFETIVKASCHLPDLIVVDSSLGEDDVKETTELLATCPATAHIPVVRL